MDLSIVIPAFEESTKIGADIEAASQFLEGNHFTGEIIVVDDGSGDGTSDAAKKAGAALPVGISLKVIRYEPHRGKGCAVRTGMKETGGEYVMFADSGCCVPYGNALLGLEMLRNGSCNIAHGSRKLLESDIQQEQPWYRRITARLFKWLLNRMLTMPPGITDSQCGFKIYRGEVARKLYGQCISDGFMFDVEIILLAAKEGYRIKEFPVEWVCDLDTRLSLTRAPWPVLSELITIKRNVARKSRHD
ncbi:MAG: glycosyltransferase [Planctomycetota bacterium]|jgi:dolichyl-phosphate beta-glucosyltransferase